MGRKQSKRNAKQAAARRAAKVNGPDLSWVSSIEKECGQNIRSNLSSKSNRYQHTARREAENFVQWAKEEQVKEGWSAYDIKHADRVELAQRYIDHLYKEGGTVRDRVANGPTKTQIRLDEHGRASYRSLSNSSVEQYSKAVAAALGVDWKRLDVKRVDLMEKSRSTGHVGRAAAARAADQSGAARFAEMVGCRRGVMEKLTGSDWVQDSHGAWGVQLMRDKHGKNNFHPIAPEHIAEVSSYFAGKGANERIFPDGVDSHIDIHGIRAEHCRVEYKRYSEACKDLAYRAELRAHLISRFRDPVFGNISYRTALAKGETEKAEKIFARFEKSLRDGTIKIRDENAAMALKNGRPLEYNRLALTAASVFAVDHWQNHNTIKYYMVS